MAAMLVPVGHAVGPLFSATGEQEQDSHEIRYGDGVFSLDPDELRIWTLAHGDPRRVAAEAPSRKMVHELAPDLTLEQVNGVVNRLRDVGLLVEFEAGTPQARGFAYHHQVLPLALGLGNSKDTPWYFQIGLPGIPRVIVAEDVYHLWVFAQRHPSLWEACLYISVDRQQTAADRPEVEKDPDRILAYFIDALPAMLATCSAYVDRVR